MQGTVTVFPDYQPGLADLDGFSHIILLYYFHRSQGYDLQVVPFMDSQTRGLFATRAPKRPNPLGFSIVRLEKIINGVLHISDVDSLDGTPLLDIKPYIPAVDSHPDAAAGWLQDAQERFGQKRADERFTPGSK